MGSEMCIRDRLCKVLLGFAAVTPCCCCPTANLQDSAIFTHDKRHAHLLRCTRNHRPNLPSTSLPRLLYGGRYYALWVHHPLRWSSHSKPCVVVSILHRYAELSCNLDCDCRRLSRSVSSFSFSFSRCFLSLSRAFSTFLTCSFYVIASSCAFFFSSTIAFYCV